MSERLSIQIKDSDNVAVAVHDLPAGATLESGVVTREPIPQAHKIALHNIPAGGKIIRYGVVLGYAKNNIPAGSWINEHMLELPQSPALANLPWGTNLKTPEQLPSPTRTTWLGYRNKTGPAGTRNLLGIVTTVQCAAGVVRVAVERIKRELLPKYPNVDGVVAITHPYGCGVAINAPLAPIPIRAIANVIRHPNFGGEIMVVGLGCEKLTYDRVLPPEDITPDNCLTLQDFAGHDAMMQAILDMADKKLQKLNLRRREKLPLSELLIGMQCGGSDAFSGITANPSAGYAADMLVKGGATVLFSEVTEVRDGVQMLAARCVSAEVRDKLAAEMQWYDDYLAQGGVDRDANPTPGNKKGGLANIVEKAMGSIAKSGASPIVEVLSPAEKPTKHGMIFAATPASDIVCGPCQVASGIGLQVFMTGRGTPYGLDVAPVIKVCSRNEMKEHWFDLIDISAGGVATGEKTIAEVGEEIFNMILDVASGTKQPYSDQYGFHNDMCIFNPAPIT
ncbi:MAG TPA: galactarate dehydratase [Candidatus Faecalibacterium intestinigallinarum]|uniref:Galactarate dehydratase n=1 Tax=Candidatus Faecalibacterium intestinigallinarum TaxID=2838581 RepID=A0A9D1Q8L3_9FIRM|nr:galactarate dehydratase [Candidatus Faecalibacterium intestinigallinarum]